MNLQDTEGWKAVSGVQLGIFVITIGAFIAITFIQIRKGLRIKTILPFCILMLVFNGVKIVGGILGLVFLGNKTFNNSLFIATYICDSISLGFITRAISSLVQDILANKVGDAQENSNLSHIDSYNASDGSGRRFRKGPEDEESSARYAVKEFPLSSHSGTLSKVENLKKAPFRILTIVLLAAVITNIIGTSQLDSDDTSSNSTEQTLIRVSAVLFVVGVAGLIAVLAYISITSAHCAFISQLLIAALVVLIVRCVYSLISAFHGINFSSPSKYILMFGMPKYYGCLALLPEIVADIILLVAFYKW
ncbi:hypothetical protein KGF57_003211 [Candida theae]|uniref:DUF7702 domain-containing protein n=1 Tax=Candida theae TaxID=1198502 RepID=A0AAD5FY14_9ASCO|nr:uncharacterized protein KGF57_003211 [Candida theae]KAI5957517.1 hypothetical protein KGF57_003211 [Candida theae]